MAAWCKVRGVKGGNGLVDRRTGLRGTGGWLALAAALVLAAPLAGCFTDTIPIAPPRRLAAPPKGPVIEPGSALEREHRRLLAAFGGEYQNTRIRTQLHAVSERLRLVSDRPNEYYRIVLLNSGTVNAFALPNGYIYLTRGLLALANDTAEIASVVAHEIAHVTYRHAMARAELESRSQLVSRVMSEVLENPGASVETREQSRFTMASFSRQQELDADEVGVRAIARAGFEAQGAVRFLNALARSSQIREQMRGTTGNDMLASHPDTLERITRATTLARQFGAPGVGEADRAKWLNALEGMPYGDDPGLGLVQGARYINARLKITMEAPEGFALEVSTQALLGVAAGAKEALRLDSSRMDTSKTLPVLLAQNPIEGMTIANIEERTINGLSAATGLARGKDWSFRVLLVRSGDTVYRLIFAAQGMSDAQDQRFQAAAATFRKLSDEEAKAYGPVRIRLTQASSAAAASDFVANQMSTLPAALETFTLINGLTPGEPLRAGQGYKVVKP
jgi:predicted Zn-dependent protease